MKFHFSKENLNNGQAKLQRFLEILPGACSWSVLLGLIFLSFFFPFSAAILIVAFYLSWILRILYSTIFLLLSYLQLNIEKNTDWMRRIHGIDNLPIYFRENEPKKFGRHWRQRASHKIHMNQLDKLMTGKTLPPASNDIYHLVLFPVIKEGRDILEPAIEAISHQHFPLKKIVVVFASES